VRGGAATRRRVGRLHDPGPMTALRSASRQGWTARRGCCLHRPSRGARRACCSRLSGVRRDGDRVTDYSSKARRSWPGELMVTVRTSRIGQARRRAGKIFVCRLHAATPANASDETACAKKILWSFGAPCVSPPGHRRGPQPLLGNSIVPIAVRVGFASRPSSGA